MLNLVHVAVKIRANGFSGSYGVQFKPVQGEHGSRCGSVTENGTRIPVLYPKVTHRIVCS
jgi:hypothetical protein